MLTLCAILSILPGFLGLFLLFLLVSGSVVQGEDVIIRILIGSFLCTFLFGLLAMHFSRKRRLRESPSAETEFCLTEKAYQLLADYDDMISFESAVRSLQSYQADGVEKYQILATLDKETCEFCGSMDGKTFSVSNAVIGKNVPPFHSKCRCTTVPYYDDTDLADMPRIARDPETGKTYDVPGNMTYNEWKKTVWNSRR